MDKFCRSVGPQPAKVLFVGEAPGANEEEQSTPLVGGSGDELFRMLLEAGLCDKDLLRHFQPGANYDSKGYTLGHMVDGRDISWLRLTNVSRTRPPQNKIELFFLTKTEAKKQHIAEQDGMYPLPSLMEDVEVLEREVQDTNPNVIVAGGNTALWALTGQTGITKWRGSILPTHRLIRPDGRPYKVIALLHPAYILRQWSSRAITVHDLRQRLKPEMDDPKFVDPWAKFEFITVPSFQEAQTLLRVVLLQLARGPTKIAVDIETFYRSQISSIALALDHKTAFCIPIMCSTDPRGFWPFDEEFTLVLLLREILSHPNAQIIGQNYPYDQLYIHRLWVCNPRLWRDTRTMQRVAFPQMPGSLDFLASMYNWTGGQHQYWKDENKEAVATEDDERRWRYNCRDAVETFQAYEQIEKTIEKFDLSEQLEFEMRLHALTFKMNQRGIRARMAAVDALRDDIIGHCLDHEGWFEAVVGPRVGASLKAKPWWNSPKQVGTLLFAWFKIRPELDRKTRRPSTNNDFFPIYIQREPLVKPILTRLEDYRSKQTFLRNVLNSKKPNGRFVTDYSVAGTETFRFASRQNGMGEGLNLQNVPQTYRVIFAPDPGYIWYDIDLDRADAQVVAWDADDEELKDIFRQGLDIHQINADTIGCSRQQAKAGVHATNYGAHPKTLSSALGVSVGDAKFFQDKWFELHPKIRAWHQRIEAQIASTRRVVNAWGFHSHFFDRMEDAFKAALAWIPQSTVAITINKGMLRVEDELVPKYRAPGGRFLLEQLTQTHDSAGGQWHESIQDEVRPLLQRAFLVPIPYPDPLTIPVGLKTSAISWGDVSDTPWQDN